MSNSDTLKNKKILIFQQRGWGFRVGHFLARQLQTEGAKLAALTFKNSTHKFISTQSEVDYQMIVHHDPIISRPDKYLAGDKFSLTEICRELGIDSIWPYVYTLREHVKSYKDKYYYAYRQGASDEVIGDYIMALYKALKTLFDEFKPDIILAPNFVVLPHIMTYLYAKRHNIKMIVVTDSKVKDYNIFSHSFNDDQGFFFDYLDKLNQSSIATPSRRQAQKYISEFRQHFKQPTESTMIEERLHKKSLKQKIKFHLLPLYHIYNWYTNRAKYHIESVGVTHDYRPPRIILRDHFAKIRYRKFMDSYTYYPFDKVGKFIYFPLQYQPEETIDVIAPFYANQIETARQVAMSMPDDYCLVVKEHPAMVGLRTPSYIEKVARTANIKLIDYRIPSEQILKKCALVVSPSSTTIFEAAFYVKPVIQLGNLGVTLQLPNVFKHTDLTSLAAKIKQLLKQNFHTPDYERRLENYIAAVFDTGFKLNYFGLWDRAEPADMNTLWQAWRQEIIQTLKNKKV